MQHSTFWGASVLHLHCVRCYMYNRWIKQSLNSRSLDARVLGLKLYDHDAQYIYVDNPGYINTHNRYILFQKLYETIFT